MRFRSKFGALSWAWVGLALWIVLLWVGGKHRGTIGFFAIYFVTIAALRVLVHFLTYWDLDSEFLRERRLWGTREIPWDEVAAIRNWPSEHSTSGYIAVDFARPAPMSDCGTLVTNPENRANFLAVLHKFASRATFEAFDSELTLQPHA